MPEQNRIACVGVGNVGRSWAVVFARAGRPVRLWDSQPGALKRAMALIEVTLGDLHAAGALPDPDETLARIQPAESLEEAIKGADYVQESVAEVLSVKQSLYAQMDTAAPAHAILASSTSAISGSAFMQPLTGRGRCLVVHPVNPPHVIPLVELCPTPWTDPDIVKTTRAFMQQLGQAPIVVEKEIDGFVLNRLQWALLGEAMHLVGEGYCSPEDIDQVLTHGLALRWAFIGPLAVGHLNAAAGLRGYFGGLSEAMTRVQTSLRTDYRAGPELVTKVHDAVAAHIPVSDIPDRQAWRDRRILSLKRHLASAPDFEK